MHYSKAENSRHFRISWRNSFAIVFKKEKDKKSNQIWKKKAFSNDDFVQQFSNLSSEENRSEHSIELEKVLSERIIACTNKDLLVTIDRAKMKDMKEQLQVLKYEQIVPDWFGFFSKIRDHQDILDNY